MFERKVVVRFGECDGLGHVNNGTYFTYMEDARMDIFRLFNPSLNLDTWNLIVASTRCDFLAQVSYAEELTISTWISKLGNSSFVVDHALQKSDGTYAARGQAVMLAYDYDQQKPASLWPEVRAALSEHMNAPAGVPELR
ncbi:acyl-CoA thioesterase [Alicyclobacillus ferrooxydans]|uniref:Thioesterase n=1 Tax=Alicyclobacillus ferrooxydans TaxID=471514 RepID=A0A0P9GNP4_9BACL|nr:thioesterase family protein [Alicyclobacillus ferrooxydans]KPV42097.1 thioesterase [Alicyclobacillus ferrooxydans]